MKLKYCILGAVVSTAFALSSSAFAGITVNDTDLLVFFQDTTVNDDLVLDVGPLGSLTNGESFNISTDLNYFGAAGAWTSDSGLIWSVIGVDENDQGSTYSNPFNYATDWIGSNSSPLTEKGESTQSQPTDFISGYTYSLLHGGSATTGVNGSDVFVGKAINGAYESIYNPAGGGIQDIWGSVTQQLGNVGSGSDSEALWQLEPEDTNGGTILPSSTEEGTFTLGSNGDLTYTAAVPEPSTWASIVLGAGTLLAVRRRRRA